MDIPSSEPSIEELSSELAIEILITTMECILQSTTPDCQKINKDQIRRTIKVTQMVCVKWWSKACGHDSTPTMSSHGKLSGRQNVASLIIWHFLHTSPQPSLCHFLK